MGHEFTGVVKEVGSEVKSVKVGDKVCDSLLKGLMLWIF